jgi:hypothetical protein
VLDHLGKPAEAARDDWRPARHRLDGREAEQLGNTDLTPVARHVHRGQGEDLRGAVQAWELRLRERVEEFHTALGRQLPQQVRIVTFRRVGVVPGGADYAQLGILRERLDQAVDALVRCEPADEEDAVTPNLRVGPEASRIGASVHDPRA